MTYASFYEGLYATWGEHHGYIKFICEEYITLCIGEKPNEDEHALRNTQQICLIIYKEFWDDVMPETAARQRAD